MSTLPRIVGHITPVKNNWYLLVDGQIVSFHTAFTDKERNHYEVFYSDSDTWPSMTAALLGVRYYFMRNATIKEAQNAIKEQDLEIEKVLNI